LPACFFRRGLARRQALQRHAEELTDAHVLALGEAPQLLASSGARRTEIWRCGGRFAA